MRETCKLPTRPLPSPVILPPIAVHPNRRCHTRVVSKNRQNPTELDKNRQKLVPARLRARTREANHPVGLPSAQFAPRSPRILGIAVPSVMPMNQTRGDSDWIPCRTVWYNILLYMP